MPLFPSDFKKFKYVSTDDKVTVLKHPKGHEIRIAHSALSPDLLKQLKAMGGAIEADKASCAPEKMAEGGIMANIRRSPLAGSGANATQAARDSADDARQAANGAKAQSSTYTDVRTPEQKSKAEEQAKKYGYADGGTVDPGIPKEEPVKRDDSIVDAATQRAREIYNNIVSPAPSPFSQAKAGIPDAPLQGTVFKGSETPQHIDPMAAAEAQKQVAQEQSQAAAQTAAAQQKVIAENQARTSLGMQPLDVPNVPQSGPPTPQDAGVAQAMPQPGTLNQGANSAPQAPSDPNDPLNMMQSGLNSRMAGINQEAQAKSQMGEQQNAALVKNQQIQQEMQDNYKQHYDHLDMERQALVKDIQDGHIDPAKYWNDHSKIASGIGMILAGFNPTNAPNAAINFLKHQMEMNLDSQKANLQSKQNLLSANMQQFGNLRDATTMTRIMQNDIMQNELQQAAAKATSPLAKAAAMQAAGQLKMEAAPMFQQFAMRRAMMNMANNTMGGQGQAEALGDTSRAEHQIAMMRAMAPMNPEMGKMAEEMSTRLVPGVGVAKIAVPADVREKILQHDDMAAAIKDLQKFVNTHSTILPGTADYNTGAQKALLVQSAVREGKLGTVYREGEQPLLDKFVSSNPANALKMLNTVPQLKELLNSNERSGNILKKQYGLPVMHQADPNQQAEAWARANPKDPRSAQILKHLGR